MKTKRRQAANGKDGIWAMETNHQQELYHILLDHAKRYPLMEPCDAVKLVFQNEFGGEHLICEPNATLAWLRAERAATPNDPDAAPVEEIGNGMVRVALATLEFTERALRVLNRDFFRSAQIHVGRRKTFLSKLDTLRMLAEEKVFAFTRQELEGYLERYISAGCCPLSHSPTYRAAYRPAYRVVKRSSSVVALFRELEQLRDGGKRAIVAIDGRCGAGKSTLAVRLEEELGLPAVHMDHFFLSSGQRTRERLDKPGGNIDYERFQREVLNPLAAGEDPVYRPYSCQTGELGAPIALKPSPVVIVEGSYACHPALWDSYHRRVFLTVDPEEQLRRIERRGGREQLRNYQEKWIPMEERYFSAFQIEDRCDYQLEL